MGKAMACAALGRAEESTHPAFDDLIAGFSTVSPDGGALLGAGRG
ncbi:hypothetical protein ACFVT2_04160 [Streptomyces sp. NPDC058000]